MEYVVNTGQDCSSFVLMDYTGLKRLPFFFDYLIVWSDDWTKVFQPGYIEQE